MADRSIKVALRANVSDFRSQMAQASKSLEEVAKSGDSTGKVANTTLGKLTQSARLQSAEWSKVSNSLLGVGAAGAAAFGGIVKVASDFEQQMSAVQAATLASSSEMDVLREAAKQAGADTAFSATEAAQGIEELAKAGVSTSDILDGGLSGALNLAAAGGLSVQEAAESAASAMVQFKLEGSDVTHVADLLAAGANKAQGGVSDLAMALSQAGVVASGAGLSIEDTVGALTAFASAGLTGSDAGTSFKSMLQRLQNPSKESKTLMDQLGISLYDTSGNVVTMANLAGQLEAALGGMTSAQRDAALAQIFGSDAVRAANILYAEGADGIAEWTDEIDAAGYAEQVAAARMDNLAGAWETFTGSAETLAINLGEKLLPTLTDVVNGVTDVVNWFSSLPDPVQDAALILGGFVTVGGLAVGGLMKMFTWGMSVKSAFTSMSTSTKSATGALGRFVTKAGFVAAAAIPVVEGLAAISRIGDKTAASVDQTAASLGDLDSLFADIGSDYDDMAGALDLLLGDSFNAKMERFGHGLNDNLFMGKFADQVKDAEEQFENIGEALAQLVDEGSTGDAAEVFNQIAEAAEKQGFSIDEVLDLMPAYADALARVDTEADSASGSSEDVSTAVEDVADAAESASEAIDEYVQSLNDAAGVQLSLSDAQIQWQQSIADATDALSENGATLDITTEAGRNNRAALDDVASSAWDLVTAMYESDGATADLEGTMSSARQKFIDTAVSMGMPIDQAEELADKYGLIPDTVRTDVIANTGQASSLIDQIADKLDSLPTSKTITVKVLEYYSATAGTTYSASGGSGSHTDYSKHATGGPIPGYGGGDIVPSLLEPGEYVVNKVAAAQHRDLLDQLNYGTAQKYATGGTVGYSTAYTPASTVMPQTIVQTVQVPTSITVVDVNGELVGRMRVEANTAAKSWIGAL